MKLQEAAVELGVHYQTAYRWVRDGRLGAVKVDSSYEVAPEEVQRLLARRSEPTPPPPQAKVRSWTNQVERLLPSLLAGDELEAWNTVERLATHGVPLLDVCERLLAPAMAEIGRRWHDGQVTIAQEHRASAITERIIARITPHPRGRPRGVCIVAAVPGDQHQLPTSMAALALREDHWRVHHLGINLTEDELVEMATEVGASLVVLSAATPEMRKLGQDLAQRLERQGVAVLSGGPGAKLSTLVEQARQLSHR